MFSEVGLIIWSAFGLTWSFLSWRLVSSDQSREISAAKVGAGSESLSIFKPLPPLGKMGMEPFAAGLESFAMQLGEKDEMLIGIHPIDEPMGTAFATRMKSYYPNLPLKLIIRSEPDELANPKVSWQKILAPHATGEWWLWSDSDIVAPPGYLRAIREEFRSSGARMMTSPYIVQEIANAPALLDALFVNIEFYPGLLLLRRLGPIDFGLGAGMLFRKEDFFSETDWQKIGSALADDFVMGQTLQPVRLSLTQVMTRADESGWADAIRHYLRWSKTIRWNRPGGTAARAVVLPILGWLAYCLFHPARLFGWMGLAGMIQVEVLFAALILQQLGCPLRLRDGLTLESWTVWRCWVWLICWIPWPVFWRGQRWPGPYLNQKK